MVLEFLSQYQDIVLALGIVILSIIIAELVSFILKRYAYKTTQKTKTILDDMIIKAVRIPIFIIIVLFGVYFATKTASLFIPYVTHIDTGFTIIFILFAALFAIRIINTLIEWYAIEMAHKTKSKVDDQLIPIFKKIVYIIVFAIALVWMLNQLGVEITTLVATLGIGGLAIALALQPTLSNFFAGAYMIMDRPVKIGDYVELDSGDKGYVEDIGWRSTRIRTYQNNLVIIPNSKLAESKITNYFSPNKSIKFTVGCGVGYREDLERVEKITLQVAMDVLKKTGIVVKDFKPIMRYKEFGDSNINFIVLMKVPSYSDQFKVKHEFIKALKKCYDKEGIEISWPVRKIYKGK